MLKSLLTGYPLIFLGCLFIGSAQAYPEPGNDPLQVYRDEIKQSETNASQSVLDALQTNTEDPAAEAQQSPSTPPKPSTAMQTPRSSTSNADNSFTPKDNTSANSTPSPNKNPWLKPNPWGKQPPNIWEKNAKVNPYANAPIPGPASPNVTTNTIMPSPPNIFSPSQPTHSKNP